jgi:hypothetical protein
MQPQQAQAATAEGVEGRELAKGNAGQHNRVRPQGRTALARALDRGRQAAKEQGRRLTALWPQVYPMDRRRGAYYRLHPDAAPGVEGQTWAASGEPLDTHLRELAERLQRGAYHAPPVARVSIPKADGRQRPSGQPTLADKMVQRATVEVLNAIYEPEFRGCSYGARPGRSPHHALAAVTVGIEKRTIHWVRDADIRGCYDRTPSYPWQQPTGSRRHGSRGHSPKSSAVWAPLCAALHPPAPPQCGRSLRRLPRHDGAADSPGGDQSDHTTARVSRADSTSRACHNRAHVLRGAMRGALPCNPTQLWPRLSPTWQTRLRADLTALFQEVSDAQLRPHDAPTSGPQGGH